MKSLDLTHEQLTSAGYVRHPNFKEHCLALYEKIIRNRKGEKLYFIHIDQHDWSVVRERMPKVNLPEVSYSLDVYLYRSEHDFIQVHFPLFEFGPSLSEVEKTIKKMYHSLKCIPNPHNN